jgi:hypothetical protein
VERGIVVRRFRAFGALDFVESEHSGEEESAKTAMKITLASISTHNKSVNTNAVFRG